MNNRIRKKKNNIIYKCKHLKLKENDVVWIVFDEIDLTCMETSIKSIKRMFPNNEVVFSTMCVKDIDAIDKKQLIQLRDYLNKILVEPEEVISNES